MTLIFSSTIFYIIPPLWPKWWPLISSHPDPSWTLKNLNLKGKSKNISPTSSRTLKWFKFSKKRVFNTSSPFNTIPLKSFTVDKILSGVIELEAERPWLTHCLSLKDFDNMKCSRILTLSSSSSFQQENFVFKSQMRLTH